MAQPVRKSASDNAISAALAELQALLGERLTTSAAIREQHGRDESYHAGYPPDAVAFARTTDEVATIVRICAAHGVPVIPFGTGTSLEGHVAALHGGVTIDLTQMNRVLRVGAADMDVTVEAGVTRKALNEHLRDTGLFFPIDPGADASLGGMTATRASGTNAVRYGTMRENVLALTVVLADGRVIRTARRSRKSAAGYDLTRLFPVARIELLDEVQMDACNRYSKLDYAVAPTLFFEFHGTTRGVAEQAEQVRELASGHGGGDFQWATKPEERTKLWQARHDAYYAALALKPGCKGWATDVCVPISRLADCIAETKEDLAASSITAALVGHVGDGNFHLVYLLDPNKPEEIAEASALNDRMVARALAMEGTCTGEHGVGYGKLGFMQAEHGDAVSVMRQIKLALDPANLMNPGKLVRV
ncbi:MAG: FAD-binding protein [Proteobacteria bacterium]|nr:FAD-binding protein [Pseudomonadota bacterium]